MRLFLLAFVISFTSQIYAQDQVWEHCRPMAEWFQNYKQMADLKLVKAFMRYERWNHSAYWYSIQKSNGKRCRFLVEHDNLTGGCEVKTDYFDDTCTPRVPKVYEPEVYYGTRPVRPNRRPDGRYYYGGSIRPNY